MKDYTNINKMNTEKLKTTDLKNIDIKFLRKTIGEKQFEEFYVGKFKNHIRKIRGLFNNPKINYTRTNQSNGKE
jgi:hypothetical protein